MSVVRVALPVAAAQLFDYWAPDGVDAAAGSLVRVRLARRRVAGVVVATDHVSSVPRASLVPVDEVVDLPPLPEDVRELVAFVSGYYQAPIGLAFALAAPPLGASATVRRSPPGRLALTDRGRQALPARLHRSPMARTLYERLTNAPLSPDTLAALAPGARRILSHWRASGLVEEAAVQASDARPLRLNDAQREAADAIIAARGGFAPFLLQGVTGSGKTEVYLAAAASALDAGGQVLLLVPEINLTPQLVAHVTAALPGARTVTLHSALADGERRANWRKAATGEANVVLGTRLAVFAPLPRLSLVVVDEEHDASYKQQDGVRYHARDAAVWRAHRRGIPVVLGSATPSLESYAHADAGRYVRLRLPLRADPRAVEPRFRRVAARDPRLIDGLSPALLDAIGDRLRCGEQSLVFINRRGYAPSLKCGACAWEAACPRCSARLVVHRAPAGLVCHHCGHRERMPGACPSCGNVDLLPAGHGTQRLEEALRGAFPEARIARVDRDSTRQRGAFDTVRARMAGQSLDILVGTQMLAKGHDFPRLTLVGVLGADNALYSADFRATERLAALLVQVAGRAGRADLPGEVIVQTDFPDHPLYAMLVRHDFDGFARSLLDERRASGLPPFAHLALFTAEAHRREDADRFLVMAHASADATRRALGVAVEVFDPVPSPLARRGGFERAQMLVRSESRGDLQRLLLAVRQALGHAPARRVRWAIDVDPSTLA